MEKVYCLSKLFKEEEFDAQRNYIQHGTKESYFSALYNFTVESEKILDSCTPNRYINGYIDIVTLSSHIEKLQEMLGDIGALNLAWNIQDLSHLLEKKLTMDYVNGLNAVLLEVGWLRERIIDAEKTEKSGARNLARPGRGHDADGDAPGEKRQIKPRSGDFKKLLMLIDNFELESAADTAISLMDYSYTPKIDESLSAVCQALADFNYDRSLCEAKNLLGLAIYAEEAEKPVRKTILAIDDMPDALRTVKAMLNDRYNVFGMTSYVSALKFLRGNPVDLILLDIEMPNMDGFTMLQLFRKIPIYAKTPIIFFTGNASYEHIQTAIRLGANDFIKKPADLAVLVSKIEDALLQE